MLFLISYSKPQQKTLYDPYTTCSGFAYSFNLPLYLSLPHSLRFSHMGSCFLNTTCCSLILSLYKSVVPSSSSEFSMSESQFKGHAHTGVGRPGLPSLMQLIIQCHSTLFTVFKALLSVQNYLPILLFICVPY